MKKFINFINKEEKTITITKDQFHDAVIEASEKFAEKLEDAKDGDHMVKMMMSMQNLAFGASIAKILFGESEDK